MGGRSIKNYHCDCESYNGQAIRQGYIVAVCIVDPKNSTRTL